MQIGQQASEFSVIFFFIPCNFVMRLYYKLEMGRLFLGKENPNIIKQMEEVIGNIGDNEESEVLAKCVHKDVQN